MIICPCIILNTFNISISFQTLLPMASVYLLSSTRNVKIAMSSSLLYFVRLYIIYIDRLVYHYGKGSLTNFYQNFNFTFWAIYHFDKKLNLIPFELLNTYHFDNKNSTLPFELLNALIKTSALPFELLNALVKTSALPFELLNTLIKTSALPFELLNALIKTSALPFEL